MNHLSKSDRRRRLVGFYAVALLLTVASTTDALPLPGVKTVVIAYAGDAQKPGNAEEHGRGRATVSVSFDSDLFDDARAKVDAVVKGARVTFSIARTVIETAVALGR